jgi:acyl carrier protein
VIYFKCKEKRVSREEVFERVTDIFRDVFDDDELVISDSTNSEDIEDWDSLEHIQLIVGMEKEFKVKFDIKTVNSLENVGQMVDLILSMI